MNRLFNILRTKKNDSQKLCTDTKMYSALSEWCDLYENKKGADGISRSLNLASAVSSELARLVTVEFESKVTGGNRAKYLDAQYQRVVRKARLFTEYACAKGGVVLKPYFENGNIYTSIIQPESFCPTAFTSDGEICGAIFSETFFQDGVYYTRIEEHKTEDGCCIITNKAYKSKDKDTLQTQIPIQSVGKWKDIEPYCRIENIKRPLFVYFKMPMANATGTLSPLGVSVFSGACDLIRDAYSQYSNLLWEFESGKRALYLDECAVRHDEDGNALLPEKRLYRMLTTDNDALFEDWSPNIREENILRGLDRILKSIEFNCGLAYGTLSDTQHFDKTAEEIKASKQRSYSTVCDIQAALKKALCELLEIMDLYCDIYKTSPKEEYFVNFSFDDSIICDENEEFSQRLLLVGQGIIAPWEMRMWYLGEDEDTARKKTQEMSDKFAKGETVT